MKKILIIPILLIMASCSKEHKAESMVHDYLQNTLNDPKSYESVSFGKLNTEYQKGKLYGYNIEHVYRAKNVMGGLILSKEKFEIDSSFSKVLYADQE